ncbi:MAG TPA: ATP-binding protein [Pseudogracilibacillus sp.]|nr:ATP-binding protein [Pseudogracilibacillus sp.]
MMFWRSVVGKLAVTILLLVSFVLFILTILLLEFFENFHVKQEEIQLIQTANKMSKIVKQYEDEPELASELISTVKEPSSKAIIYFENGTRWVSDTTNILLLDIEEALEKDHEDLLTNVLNRHTVNDKVKFERDSAEVIVVGMPLESEQGGIFLFQTLDVINQTRAQTTKIIFVAAGIAIVLTTIFAFFLSTRITAPLIRMREAASGLAKGEFDTEVPVLTHDEIGELAITFNRMARQLHFHMNALRQEKEQLSSLVNSMADGVITLTRSGDITVLNPPAEQFIQDWYFTYNLTAEKKVKELPEDLKQILLKVLEEKNEIVEEITLNGRHWVLFITPLYDHNHIRGAVAVIRDMTEERQLDKLRKDFISNVSHELRTPIALLRGYSEAIVDDIAESVEDKNELAQIIHDESVRMERLVNELLDIGRIEAGHIELNTEQVSVDAFIERIYKKFSGAAVEQGIELRLKKDITKDIAIFDPDRIDQVFTNLISNALAHTKEGGYVLIDILSDEDVFYVEIEDNGSGIPEEDLPFIFERFYKADKSRKRSDSKQGTGLGLAIAKHIITAHKGTISVKSEIDVGTTFSFTIPQKEERS